MYYFLLSVHVQFADKEEAIRKLQLSTNKLKEELTAKSEQAADLEGRLTETKSEVKAMKDQKSQSRTELDKLDQSLHQARSEIMTVTQKHKAEVWHTENRDS